MRLSAHPLGHQPHQDVVVDPVEELLQVDVHHNVVAGRDVRLRLCHRLMRRAPRPEAVARLGERPVPVRLQHLQHRLLDEAVEHRRNAERPRAARRLRYLDPPHRLRLVGAVEQLSPDRGPVLLQVGRAGPRRSSRRCPRRPCCAFTCASAFLRFSRSTIASIDGPAAAGLSASVLAARASVPSAAALRGFTRCSGAEGQLDLVFLPHGPYEIAALLASSTVRAFGGSLRLLCPLLTSAPRSRPPCDALSPDCRDTAQISRGKIDRLRRTPAGFTTPVLDGCGLRDHLLARPAG